MSGGALCFPVSSPGQVERALAILEAGAYPFIDGPSPKQAPIYGIAQHEPLSETIIPGPATAVTETNPQRQEQLRRLRPMTRW